MMTFLLKLINWLLGKTAKSEPESILAPPKSTERIDYGDLYALLRLQAPTAEIFLSDRNYLLCRESDIVRFLVHDKTNKIQYKAEAYDCDDFAYRLMGQITIPAWSDLAFGLIWTDKHALNCYIDEDKQLWFVEPQADTLQTGLLNWQGDHIRLIIM